MKLVLLDGTYGNSCLESRKRIENELKLKYEDQQVFKLEDLSIAYCTGCWSCWTKTPGKCVHNDDTQILLKAVINADMVIHFTENTMGFTSSLTKKAMDKFVALIHPHITVDNKECHHVKRYDRYPTFGLVYIDDKLNQKDFEISKKMIERAALNFKSSLSYSRLMIKFQGGEANETRRI